MIELIVGLVNMEQNEKDGDDVDVVKGKNDC